MITFDNKNMIKPDIFKSISGKLGMSLHILKQKEQEAGYLYGLKYNKSYSI
jgi:hypothetical protein